MINITFIIVAFFTVQVLSQTNCTINPLRSVFNFTGPNRSVLVADSSVCKSLSNVESCCDANSFKSIQTKIDTLLVEVRNIVAEKDVVITNVRLNVLPAISRNLKRLEIATSKLSGGQMTINSMFGTFETNVPTEYTGEIVNRTNTTNSTNCTTGTNCTNTTKTATNNTITTTNITTNSTNSINSTTTTTTTSSTIKLGILSDYNSVSALVNQIPLLKASFISYQKERQKCVVQLMKLQSATYCLACDPRFESKGLSQNGSLVLSTTAQSKLLNACYNYFDGTEQQTGLLDTRLLNPVFSALATAMEKIANGDTKGFQELSDAQGLIKKVTPATDNNAKPTKKPTECTKQNCSFILNEVFNKGKIDTSLLAYGGKFESTSLNSLFTGFSNFLEKRTP